MDKQPQQALAIAHRGLSCIFPENTIQSLTSALFCSKLVEFDIILTQDKKIIIYHDRGLKRITNINTFPKFNHLLKTQTIDYYHKQQQDWWVRDFTLQQLQQLSIKQEKPSRPQLHLHRTYNIVTLQEFLIKYKLIREKYGADVELAGLLIQIKQQVADSVNDNDKQLCSLLCEMLTKHELDSDNKILIQSFCLPILTHITTKNHLVQLFDYNIPITTQLLTKQKIDNIYGIGITQQHLLQKSENEKESVKQICKKFGYRILYWTIKDDEPDKIPLQCSNYKQLYQNLKFKYGVHGFITQFPHLCQKYLNQREIILGEIYKKLEIEM